MRKHGIFTVFVAVGVLSAGAGVVCGQSAPASQRASVGSPLEKVHAALELSPKEQMVLSTLRDGTETSEHNAFYLMMAKVVDLPTLSSAEMRGLDAPAVANLLRRPGRYRCQPMRLTIRVYYVTKQRVGRGLTANPYWPQDRPIYRIDGTVVGGDEPVIVYCPAVPPDLPKPTAIDRDGEMQFKNGPKYDLAGVFFQTIRCYDRPQNDRIAPQMRDYPVILAWQVSPVGRGGLDVASGNQAVVYLGGVILLAIVFGAVLYVILQKRIAARKREGVTPTFGGYRPLRDPREAQPEEFASAEPVDPDLAAAAEEHRKHRMNEEKPG